MSSIETAPKRPPEAPAVPHGRELGEGGAPTAPPPAPGSLPWLVLGAIAIVLAIGAAITLYSRQRDNQELEKDTYANSVPTVAVVHPKRTSQQLQLDLPGNITAFEDTPIYARVSGYLKKWYTDIGTHVQAGQLLAEIETPELDQELNQANAALAQANANLEIARISAERWQSLRKSDSVSQQDTDTRVATWHARQADVQAEEANVQRLTDLSNFKRLTAPFPGIITVRSMDAGTLVTAGSSHEIFRLARTNPLRVYLSLPQAYSQMVKTNDAATLTFDEMPGEKFAGIVDRTAGALDPASRTLLTEVLVTNSDGRLFPGAHVMVELHVTSSEDPVVVPVNTLLFRNDQGVQAGVVQPDNTVKLVDVTVGRDYGTTVEIVHGLAESDNVILNPSDSIEAGAKVNVAPPSPAAKSQP